MKRLEPYKGKGVIAIKFGIITIPLTQNLKLLLLIGCSNYAMEFSVTGEVTKIEEGYLVIK